MAPLSKTLVETFGLKRSDNITLDYWNGFLGALDAREAVLLEKKATLDELEAQILNIGLSRVNEILGPAAERISAIAEIGFLTASSTTTRTLVQGAPVLLVVAAGDQRALFTPTPLVVISDDTNYLNFAVARTVSYDRDTGEFLGNVLSLSGSGGPNSQWTISGVAGSTIAQMDALAEGLAARTDAQTYAAQSASSATAAGASAGAAGTSAAAAGVSAQGAKDALTAFKAIYYGARSTAPAGAALGSQYLDTSQTPNVFLVLTAQGWKPTVSVSIGGVRRIDFPAVAYAGGATFAVPGGFDSGDVYINGVLQRQPGEASLNPGEAGTFTLSRAVLADETVSFRGYLANTATDIYTKREVEDRITDARRKAKTSFRNRLINGAFAIAQRALSQTTAGYGSDDRWFNDHQSGASKTHSIIKLGSGVYDARNVSRTVFQSGNGAFSVVRKFQWIENVNTFAGRKATLSFRAAGNVAGLKVAAELIQNFGSGASASPQINSIGVQQVTLGTNLLDDASRFALTFDVPSISGKTLGPNGDDKLGVCLYFDAGAQWDARTGALGYQSGTIDITEVQIEEGEIATPFEMLPTLVDLQLCQRFFRRRQMLDVRSYSGDGWWGSVQMDVVGMRNLPSISYVVNESASNIKNPVVDAGVGALSWQAAISQPIALRVNVTMSADAEL